MGLLYAVCLYFVVFVDDSLFDRGSEFRERLLKLVKNTKDSGSFLGRKGVIFVLSVVVVVILLISYKVISSKKETVTSDSLPPVMVGKAELGSVIRYINAIGTLRPYNSVIIKSEVSAVISKIHFHEGASANEGDLLIELDDKGAKAALMEAEAAYRKAKSEYDPVEKLADRGVMAKVNRDKLKAEMDMCAAKVESCKNVLEKHRITAPFEGVVGLREVSEGQFVSPGNELVKLVDCNPLKVDFRVIEADIKNVYVGQEVKVLVGGDQSEEFDAKIIAIDPESDKISHSFNVRAILGMSAEAADEFPALKPGRFVSVKIIPEESQKGILVPESCLEKVGDEYYLYRLIEGIAVRTMVTTGMHKNGFVEIITGVNDGETVITSGQQGVLDGRGVSIQTPESLERMKKDIMAQIAKLKQQQNGEQSKKENGQKTQIGNTAGANSNNGPQDLSNPKKKKKKKKGKRPRGERSSISKS